MNLLEQDELLAKMRKMVKDLETRIQRGEFYKQHAYDHGQGGRDRLNVTSNLSFGTPSGNIDIGDTNAAGSAATAARSDHGHAFAAPGAGYPQNVSLSAESDGTAATPARSDHVHLLSLTPGSLDSANFTGTNWTDLTDTGATTLHKHDHGGMDGLADDDHTQYLLASGTRGLSAAWDAGSWQIRAETFQSDVATGTAPLTVASTTKVTNLNADLLDDQSGSYYLDSANFTGTNWTDLTDAGATTLHTHTLYSRMKYVNVPDAAVGVAITAGDAQGAILHSGPSAETADALEVDAETAPGASGLPVTWQYGDTNDLDTVASWTTIATYTLSSEKSNRTTSMTTATIPANRLIRTNWGTIVGTPKDATTTLHVKSPLTT